MTRYEKFKEGIAFLHGEESAKTIEDAAETALDFIDCYSCPAYKSCVGECEEGSLLKECKKVLLAYLSEEIE